MFWVPQLGLRSTQVYIVRSCAEDGRGLSSKISDRSGDRVPKPTLWSFGEFKWTPGCNFGHVLVRIDARRYRKALGFVLKPKTLRKK